MSGKNRNAKNSAKATKHQRQDSMARKRDERAAKAAHKKARQVESYLADDESYGAFKAQLAKMGLELRDITGDGNCLFRALGDQLEGHVKNHLKHRRDVVNFMIDHREDFEPFVEDDVPFEKHMKNLNEIGTYAGNDAIVAFSRLHSLHIIIHQVNTPCWQIHGTENQEAKELHISYHNGDHYSSIRRIGDNSDTPANIKLDSALTSNTLKKDKVGPGNGFSQGDWQDESYLYNGDYAEVIPCEGSTDTVETIKRLTCCEDESLILQTLEDVNYDIELATDIIMDIMHSGPQEDDPSPELSADNGLWSTNGTGSRLFGGPSNSDNQSEASSHVSGNLGAKPKQQSNSRQKQAKKREKKLRAEQRRRTERLGTVQTCASEMSSDDDGTVTTVAHVMGTLKI